MTRDQLIEAHGEELGEALWWCAVLNGEAILESVADRDPLAIRPVDFFGDYCW